MRTGIPQTRGFTLLELAIVLTLIGAIIGMGLVTLTSSLQASEYNVTVTKMDAIEKTLLDYAVANNRLPCPSDLTQTVSSSPNYYGMEAGAGSGSAIGVAMGVCTGTGMLPQANFVAASGTVEGGVPTRALQLADDYMYDGWGRKFRYAVDPTYTKSSTLPATVSGSCSSASASAITVNDATGAARTTAGMYAIVSHGANGHGAYTSAGVTLNAGSVNADELTNCHCTSAGAYSGSYTPTYVEKVPMQDPSNALDNFDDIVTFKEPWQMQTPNFPLSPAPAAQCLYIADPGNCRVEIFTTKGTYVSQFGSCGSGNGQFSNVYASPGYLATDTKGNVWAADFGNTRVEQFSSTGTYLATISGHFNRPASIAIDPSGNIWVGDAYGGSIVEFNSSGTYVKTVGTLGSGNGQFYYSPMVAADASGNIWVADQYNNRVQEFSNSGGWLQSIGGPSPYTCETSPAGTVPACASGSGNGQFGSPWNVSFDSGGNVWVNDGGGPRMEKFTSSGTYISQFGSWGVGNGQWRSGDGSAGAIDASGNIWVTDGADDLVEKFDSNGSFLFQFGSSGAGNGQFGAVGPQGIAISSR